MTHLTTAVLLASLLLLHPRQAGAWIDRTLRGGELDVTLDPAGDVIAGGGGYLSSVVKLASDTGAVLWEQGALTGNAFSVAADATGDVVAAGQLFDPFTPPHSQAAVAKYAGTTGTEVWRTVFAQSEQAVAALEPGGDPVGALQRAEVPGRFTVFRLDGATGATVWRQDVFGTASDSAGAALALDVDTDVLAAGQLSNDSATPGSFAVVKLALATGAELWRYGAGTGTPLGDKALSVTRDANGDVIATGTAATNLMVVKLAGTTGAELWRYVLPDPPFGTPGAVTHVGLVVGVDPGGDVLVGGRVGKGQFGVLKLAGGSGTQIWRKTVAKGLVADLAIDPSGDVVAVGTLAFKRFVAMRFDGLTGKRRWSRAFRSAVQFGGAGAESVVLDAAGNPVVAGAAGQGVTVAKLCRKNGAFKDTAHCPL